MLNAESAPTHLFDPITLRSVEFRNRLWVSPMCMYAAENRDGMANDWHDVHYSAMARGGAGLVVVEATAVTPEGRISPNCLGLWNDTQRNRLQRISELVHQAGGKIAVQLAHAGRKASTEPWLPGCSGESIAPDAGGWQTVAPSAIAFGEFSEPRALNTSEIAQLVDAFAASATRAVNAGFDAVEVHAAHGYLLHEFLSPFSNQRDDEYGGSLENRARFLLEVVERIREQHPQLPVIVRISATEWVEGGFDLSEVVQLVGMLAAAGADLVDASSAANIPAAQIPVGPAYQAPLAAQLRGHGLPIGTVGMITSASQAQTILTLGQADVVSVGREWLRNPYLGLHWTRELRADIATLCPDQLWRAFPLTKR